MSCANCTKTKTIPKCTDTINVGWVRFYSGTIYLFVKNLNNGRIHRQSATTDSNGFFQLDLTDPDANFFGSSSAFEFWASLSDTNQSERLDVYLYGSVLDSHQCFELNFETIYDSADALLDYTSHTLQLDVSYTAKTAILDVSTREYIKDDANNQISALINNGSGGQFYNDTTAELPDIATPAPDGGDYADFTETSKDNWFFKTNPTYSGQHFEIYTLFKRIGTSVQLYYDGVDSLNAGNYFLMSANATQILWTEVNPTTGKTLQWKTDLVLPTDSYSLVHLIRKTDGTVVLFYNGVEYVMNLSAAQTPNIGEDLPIETVETRVAGIGAYYFLNQPFIGSDMDWLAAKVFDEALSEAQRQEIYLDLISRA